MCELFGFSASQVKDIRSYLKEFYGHCKDNPHGWGLAFGDGPVLDVYSEPVIASSSTLLPQLLENRIDSKTVLAHIRHATVGNICQQNCHPFGGVDALGRHWLLMHNGTVFNGLELLRYHSRQAGNTDSERLLLYLLDQINQTSQKHGALTAFERFRVVEKVISALSYRNKLNLLIFDGEQIYVHVNMRYTLFYKSDESGTMFATVPFNEPGWEELPMTTLLVYQNGALKYRGENHHKEFIDGMSVAPEHYNYHI